MQAGAGNNSLICAIAVFARPTGVDLRVHKHKAYNVIALSA